MYKINEFILSQTVSRIRKMAKPEIGWNCWACESPEFFPEASSQKLLTLLTLLLMPSKFYTRLWNSNLNAKYILRPIVKLFGTGTSIIVSTCPSNLAHNSYFLLHIDHVITRYPFNEEHIIIVVVVLNDKTRAINMNSICIKLTCGGYQCDCE